MVFFDMLSFFSTATRPKSLFLLHKNLTPRDFSIMTLTLGRAMKKSDSSISLLKRDDKKV